MSTTITSTERPPRNGVDVPRLFATLDAVKGQNEIAKFQFRAAIRRSLLGRTMRQRRSSLCCTPSLPV